MERHHHERLRLHRHRLIQNSKPLMELVVPRPPCSILIFLVQVTYLQHNIVTVVINFILTYLSMKFIFQEFIAFQTVDNFQY
jgi:hypothetical protein